MKIRISEEPGCEETEVLVRCREMDDEVLRLLARLRVLDAKLTGERDGATCLLDAGQVLYADTADKRTFLYTAEGVYETALRLYELEERLNPGVFVRISHSEIVNLKQVTALDLSLAGTIKMTLAGGAAVCWVSRRYVPKIKQALGLGRGRRA